MKKSNLITCFAISLAIGGATAAGFVSQSAKSGAAISQVIVPANETKTIYVDMIQNTDWEKNGARFAIYGNNNGNWEWITDDSTQSKFMSTVSIGGEEIENMYKMNVPTTMTTFLISRQNPAYDDPSFDYQWNQTVNYTLNDDNNGMALSSNTDEDGKYLFSFQKKFYNLVDGYYLTGSFNSWDREAKYLMEWNEEKSQFEYHSFALKVDDEFKINYLVRMQPATDLWFGFGKLHNEFGQARYDKQLVAASADADPNIKAAFAGSYDLYLKNPTSSSVKIYVPSIKNYSLKVDDESYNLVANTDPEHPNQLMTENKVQVTAGQTISLFMNDKQISANTVATGNNNAFVNNESKIEIVLNMNAKIYVNPPLAEGQTSSIYCGGLSVGDKGISLNNNFVKMIDNPSKTNEWMVQGLELKTNDQMKFVNTVGVEHATLFPAKTFETSTELKDLFELNNGYLVYKGTEDKCVDMYLDTTSSTDKVYIQTSGTGMKEAIDFAKEFEKDFLAVCDASGATKPSDIQNTWTASATKFESISVEAAKSTLKSVTTSSANEDLAKFAARYDQIFGKYGSSLELTNFAGRDVTSYAPINVFNQNSIIYILTGVGVIALSALAIILVKKKKTK